MNIIKFGNKKIKFSHNSYEDSNEMEFYGFHISPDYPCLNPNHAPK